MKSLKRLLIVTALLSVVILAGCTKEGYVANKISVMGIDVGSMSREEAIMALENVTLNPEEAVTVLADGEIINITAGEIGAEYDSEKTVDFLIEESKGFFSGWFKKEYPMKVDANEELIDEKLGLSEREVVQTSGRVVENGIEITNGVSGLKLEKESLYGKITDQFSTDKKEEIKVSFEVAAPDKVGAEFLKQFMTEYKDAAYERADDGTITVTESAAGVDFDLSAALDILNGHTEEGEVYTIPATVTLPTYSKEYLTDCLFRDTFGTYTTHYKSSNANRCSNIDLASKSIDGTVLMPGDVFSFNDALGERTVQRGYKAAGAYVAGETVEQVGGGICQVSSTLYNSALLANLEITSRRSHQMTVSYVPMGRDATVNWGTTDFKFKNNTAFPIKISSTIAGKSITISIVGTLTIPGMKVDILTNTSAVLEPPVETVDDPTMLQGETKVTSKGSSGYVVDAVRVVYSNGNEISRETLTKSRYNPKKSTMLVGTMVPEGDAQMGVISEGGQVPVVDIPVVEAPVIETPVVETPVVEAPVVEAPIVEAPVVEAPVVETSVIETPVQYAVSDTGI